MHEAGHGFELNAMYHLYRDDSSLSIENTISKAGVEALRSTRGADSFRSSHDQRTHRGARKERERVAWRVWSGMRQVRFWRSTGKEDDEAAKAVHRATCLLMSSFFVRTIMRR
jgi:hypothetical protein